MLELMFLYKAQNRMYRYEDLTSKATDYIAVMDLEAKFCEWKNKSAMKEVVFVAVQDATVVTNTTKLGRR